MRAVRGKGSKAIGAGPRRRLERALAWLVAPACLTAVGAAAWVVLGADERSSARLLALGLCLAGAGVLGWVLVSVFYPARADRTCPRCGEQGLERLERESTRGVACRLCGHVDASASSFLIAESEGALEPVVLRERRERGARGRP